MNPKNHWVKNFCFNFCFLFLLYLKLPNWKLYFFVIPSWKEMKKAFPVQLQAEKLCFCFRKKLNKIRLPKTQNKNLVFKHLHQNVRPIWTNDWGNIAYWEESEQTEMLANKFGWSQRHLGILVLVTAQGKCCNFPPLSSLEAAFPALKLTENCYLNMNISFPWKMTI